MVAALADAGADGGTGETALAGAATPALDRVGRLGRAGVIDLGTASPWEGTAALLGADPGALSLGAVEALGAGVPVAPGEAAWRADFVTADDSGLHDAFGGKVGEPEAGALLAAAAGALPGVRLHRLGGHRNLAVAAGPAEFAPTPFEMLGRSADSGLDTSGRLRVWYAAAAAALAAHDVNRVRVDLGENPANALWFHGGGPGVSVPVPCALPGGASARLVGHGGGVAGLARALGCSADAVEGDDDALAAAAIAALAAHEFVIVRTESVLAAQARGGVAAKRDAISALDARVIAPILGVLEERGDFGFAVAADSAFDPRTRAISRRAVPCALLRSGDAGDGALRFTESSCARSGLHLHGGDLMRHLVADV